MTCYSILNLILFLTIFIIFISVCHTCSFNGLIQHNYLHANNICVIKKNYASWMLMESELTSVINNLLFVNQLYAKDKTNTLKSHCLFAWMHCVSQGVFPMFNRSRSPCFRKPPAVMVWIRNHLNNRNSLAAWSFPWLLYCKACKQNGFAATFQLLYFLLHSIIALFIKFKY